MTCRRPHAEWHKLLDRVRAAHKPWAEQLSRALPTLFELYTITADADTDEVIVCNCNLIPENVRMGHNDELVVTEWEFAGSLTPRLELGSALVHWTLRPSVSRTTITAFRDGYVDTAGHWPRLDLTSFAVAVTSWLNWTYNTICEAIDPADGDLAAFADREAVDLLNHPMTRSSLQEILAEQDA